MFIKKLTYHSKLHFFHIKIRRNIFCLEKYKLEISVMFQKSKEKIKAIKIIIDTLIILQ